ncbi:hypothetical protein GGR56DRAFT_649828 [Xylariaceae sp. FL0804]|nr:hypothetical protein GGR56DRAFT_649828 [Xylariaceae sp. FL0804]
MPAVPVPDAGLQLSSPTASKNLLPLQAFGLTLNDNVIEDMIRCVRKGQELELTLGSNPSFQYGSKEQMVTATPESYSYDLYLTNLEDPSTKAERLPNQTMSIFGKPPLSSMQPKRTERGTKGAVKPRSPASSTSAESEADKRGAQKSSAAAKLVNSSSKASKSKPLPTNRSAMASVLSSTKPRSLPTSPALNGISSPNPGFSASQQVLEKNKEQRSILVHELASSDQTFEHLQDVWMGTDSDLKPTVEKVAEYVEASKKWRLNKRYWKELDVWNYDYASPESRQAAIENAIRVYDRMRLTTVDPAWDKLLPREERGKGKVLSKLQVELAKQSNMAPAPRSSAQKAEDGSKSDVDVSKARGEAMSRSSSQPTSNKPKKISERDAQTKRLLSTNPKKPVPKKPVSKVKAVEDKGKKVLSEEFVYDTSSEDETPLSQNTPAQPKSKPVERPAQKTIEERPAQKTIEERPVQKTIEERPVLKTIEKAAEKAQKSPAPAATAVKAKPRPVVRAPRAMVKAPVNGDNSQKRSREDDDSSSSSGAPLSKRIKTKEPLKPAPEPMAPKHRASDASQNSRGTTSSNFSARSKNTSPAKSSPLASSPPTNASDLDEPQQQPVRRPQNFSQQHPPQPQRNGEREREKDRGATTNGLTNGTLQPSSSASSIASLTGVVNKKRKERDSTAESQQSTPAKKARVSLDTLSKARRFNKFYESYASLHYEIADLEEPPKDKLEDLLEMRERLVMMKADIRRAVT